MLQPANNFLEGLEADEFRFLRRTVIGIVLATDMASHADLLSDFTGVSVLPPLPALSLILLASAFQCEAAG